MSSNQISLRLCFDREVTSLFRKERPVGCAINNDMFNFLTHDAALGIDLVKGEEQDIATGSPGDCPGAAEGVERRWMSQKGEEMRGG